MDGRCLLDYFLKVSLKLVKCNAGYFACDGNLYPWPLNLSSDTQTTPSSLLNLCVYLCSHAHQVWLHTWHGVPQTHVWKHLWLLLAESPAVMNELAEPREEPVHFYAGDLWPQLGRRRLTRPPTAHQLMTNFYLPVNVRTHRWAFHPHVETMTVHWSRWAMGCKEMEKSKRPEEFKQTRRTLISLHYLDLIQNGRSAWSSSGLWL